MTAQQATWAEEIVPPRQGIVTVVAPWITSDYDPMRVQILANAFGDIALLEDPLGSNRGPEIDEMNREGGSPLGSYWCGNAAAKWYRRAGAITPGPGKDGSCDEWVTMARRLGLWREKAGYTPEPADAVVYGTAADAEHIALIVRVAPLLLEIGGNTTLKGYSRNGTAVALGAVDLGRVVGFIRPRARSL